MQLVRVGAAVLNQTPLAWDDNRRQIEGAIEAARSAGVTLLCLPELCITGYGCEDAFLSPGVWQTALATLEAIAPRSRGMIVSLGLPLPVGGGLYDAAGLLVDGRIAGFVCKHCLAGDGIHYEPRWFKPWPRGERTTISIGPDRAPVGDLLFDCGGLKVGFEICEDAWVADRPGAALARAGCDVILNPSASHFAFAKSDVRRRLVLEGSRAFAASYIYANLLGNEAGRAIYDGGALIASSGSILAEGPRFSFRDWLLTTAVIDVDLARSLKARSASLTPDLAAAARLRVEVPFDLPDLPVSAAAEWSAGPCPASGPPVSAPSADVPSANDRQFAYDEAHEALRPSNPDLKHEEFARAVAIGLFDYLRKSRAQGFVVSISGGVDSAAVSTLVSLMVRFGVGELGLAGFQQQLGQVALAEARDERAIVERLLTCVYQSTKNSGEVTRTAARGVAEALGARFHEFDVEPIVAAYAELAAAAEARPLTWQRDDLALQNIQARARAPGAWMLANLRGALLLSTSNRSEAAVGYCTMDGDTAGSLSPVAGIDKHYLRQWLRWMETTGPRGLGPMPALRAVNDQAPTAELRPAAAEQTDEADLMPYDVLDAVERAAIRDKREPREVWELVRAGFPQHTAAELALWVERFFRLWCRNQWKRERYAPSFHLDDENLDPKTWCRFPILSGGYERELAELRQAARDFSGR